MGEDVGSDGLTKPECNGICLYAADIGVPEAGNVVAYAHPDCPEHGEELPEMEPIMDEVEFFAQTGKLFETGELDRPEDFELAEPSYRIKLVSCHDSALIERTLDGAEFEFLRSLAGQINGLENGGHVEGCVPTMIVSQRIKPGDLNEDDNFREVIAP
jgi:hypothetical protein